MVAEVQNTLVTILRGTTVNAYGDVQQSPVVLYAHVPACLTERTQTVMDPATQTPMTVRGSICWLPAWTSAQVTDQVTDETTGDLYAVYEVIIPPVITGIPVDLKASLRRVTGTGT